MTDNQVYVSINPDDAVSGGFLADRDATIRKARFEETTYGGRSNPTIALIVGYELDGDDEIREQIYSVGPTEKYTTTEDGSRLVPQGGQKGISKQSNAYHYLVSAINAGWPKVGDRALTFDVSVLEGANVHLDEITIQREFKDQGGEARKPKPIAVITKINSFPWDADKQPAGGPGKAKGGAAKAAAPTAKSTKAPAAPAATPAVDPGTADLLARTIVLDAIVAGGGSVAKPALIQAGFKAKYDDAKLKPVVVQKVGADGFLNAGVADGLWEYDGAKVTADVETAKTMRDAINS